MYSILRDAPTSGQYLQIWEFNGNIWSDTCKVIDGRTYIFDSDEDDWQLHEMSAEEVFQVGMANLRYIIIGED